MHTSAQHPVRLVAMAWWFLVNEIHGMVSLLWIFASSGGRDVPRRRRGVYNLRIRWARIHLAGIKTLFGLRFEIEDLDKAGPGPVTILWTRRIVEGLPWSLALTWLRPSLWS